MNRYQIKIRFLEQELVSIEDFSFESGEITILFGESGIGKTLISQTIFGLVDPHDLQITVNGESYFRYVRSQKVRRLQQNGFFVFQEPSSHFNPLMTIEEQLNEGSLTRAENKREILEALWRKPYRSHIHPLLRVYPKPFRPSGGEKQRFLLAMALMKIQQLNDEQQHLFVFDEPTGSLDDRYRNIFLEELFRRYQKKSFTILLITHDYSMISEIEKNHKKLLPKIRFKELRRVSDTRVELFDFKAEIYTSWLNNQRAAARKKVIEGEKPVLKVNPTFSVFNKQFALYPDSNSKDPAELIVRRGELVYLKAPSGMGKTTLAKIITGLQKAESVRFELAGMAFNEKTPQKIWRKQIWGRRLSMVFQHADEALNLQAKVRDVFKGLPGLGKSGNEQIKKYLREIFDETVDGQFLNKKIALLSGGQKQRLNLLRALLLHPDLIILDEPLNGLDFNSIRKVIEMIREKMRRGSGILLISHNEEIFDRIVPEESCF
ncbi:MAG: ATP-binding cassette domain-containing protein [Calditrichaeota bacterium]|nr:ATP-binding cassette domain-containing protein [Calditrichota bacterium]